MCRWRRGIGELSQTISPCVEPFLRCSAQAAKFIQWLQTEDDEDDDDDEED